MSALRQALADYLAVRRTLGFKLHDSERLLAQFIAYLENRGEEHVTIEAAVAWATSPAHGHRRWLASRLTVVRRFAAYLRGLDPSTQVPPTDLLPGQKLRATPYLYSEKEISALMNMSKTLLGSYRQATYRTGVGAHGRSRDDRMASTSLVLIIPMPHKHNAERRHHIPKMSFKVQNWPAYEAGLRRRGSLTLWIEDSALECWQTTGPSGQARYMDAAIETSLMLRTVFKLALRQTEGLMTSVLTLMGLTISAPDHSTVSRRAETLPVIQPATVPPGPLHILIDSTGLQVYGAGQWLEAKHGAKSRRKWRKLHLAVDAASGMIVAQTLTDQDADDPSQVGPLLDQIDEPIGQVTADGAYDGSPTYQTIAAHSDGIEVVIPPRSTAVPSGEPGPPTQRDSHLAMIAEQGHLAWQATTGYGQRSLVETTMGRYKSLIGPRLRARGFPAQQTEAAIGVAVLNRMLATGRPDSVRRQPVIA
jgi:hypothetical protein